MTIDPNRPSQNRGLDQHQDYLKTTPLLNFDSSRIKDIVETNHWSGLSDCDRIGEIHRFVRDDIKFGYNASDNMSATHILDDGYGQCNTKSTLFMALLRATGIPCRIHGFTIDKQLQKGALPLLAFWLAPKNILHSWVEVFHENKWFNLEGFIVDTQYLHSIQEKFKDVEGQFSGYAISTTCLSRPQVDWNCSDTYIQKEGINQDLGIYSDPDSFYQEQGVNLKGIKKLLYKSVIRHAINWHVNSIRNQYSGEEHASKSASHVQGS